MILLHNEPRGRRRDVPDRRSQSLSRSPAAGDKPSLGLERGPQRFRIRAHRIKPRASLIPTALPGFGQAEPLRLANVGRHLCPANQHNQGRPARRMVASDRLVLRDRWLKFESSAAERGSWLARSGCLYEDAPTPNYADRAAGCADTARPTGQRHRPSDSHTSDAATGHGPVADLSSWFSAVSRTDPQCAAAAPRRRPPPPGPRRPLLPGGLEPAPGTRGPSCTCDGSRLTPPLGVSWTHAESQPRRKRRGL